MIGKVRCCSGFAGLVAAMLLTGCATHDAGKAALPQPPPEKSSLTPHADPASRVRALEQQSAQLSQDAHRLPGRDSAEHSRVMQQIFTDLLQTLPLLSDPSSDRVLAQRLSIIQNSRAQLAADSTQLSIEPAIDTGLRSASAAVADISHGDGYQQADLGPLLDKLSAQVNRLDVERDSDLHRIDTADAIDSLSQLVGKLAAVLGGRLTVEHTEGPATKGG